MGLLVLVAADELQGAALERADRLRQCRQVEVPVGRHLRDVHWIHWQGRVGGCVRHGCRCDTVTIVTGVVGFDGALLTRSATVRGKKTNLSIPKGVEGTTKGKGNCVNGKGLEKREGPAATVCGHCGSAHTMHRDGGHSTHPDQLPWKFANPVRIDARVSAEQCVQKPDECF